MELLALNSLNGIKYLNINNIFYAAVYNALPFYNEIDLSHVLLCYLCFEFPTSCWDLKTQRATA